MDLTQKPNMTASPSLENSTRLWTLRAVNKWTVVSMKDDWKRIFAFQ